MVAAMHHRLLLLLLLAAAAADPAKPTAYEMLERFGFPRGILPLGVRGYTFRESDGSFEVFLDGDCEFEVDGSYLLKYGKRITGKVGQGSLRELNGVTVRIFLMHLGIDRVVRSDADIRFYVGPISQSFPANNFEECPRCRCRSGSSAAAGDGAGESAGARFLWNWLGLW